MEHSRAILFADIAGSTGLYQSSGDVAALGAVVTCLDRLKEETILHGGRVVKTIGDELMAVFDTAAQAVQAANGMQSSLALSVGAASGMKLRIGCHFGPVIEADGDCFGDTVNLAARLTALASAEQILTSRETYDVLPSYLQATCRKLYATVVKGRKGPVTIIEALWKQDQGQTMLSDSFGVSEAPLEQATITYRGARWTLDEGNPEATLGRDVGSTVLVDLATASRCHARVFLRQEKLIFLDQSSNGTFVRLQNGQEIMLRREELVVSGRALVGLGVSLKTCRESDIVVIEAGG